ncbi:hypothetical protein BST81_24425 [Leptolyngbya sp. 'hensonii']|uniref:alr0857 family protein n=1 Tax=Leptolyngbya sp. 'hensonii' TaxID=1922337 RepID=UPI0009501ABC|nr:alr0857 family protein [Leptolyngbya sp. 'hensonii']OLP15770.1 hypothetical protein BST81_24425 [Leptolyngbya sp. 'hensonii']
MLKLQYTENGLFMERVSGSVETMVAQRTALVLRAGRSLHLQLGRASFLLPADMPTLAELEVLIWMEQSSQITICLVDLDTVEVSVAGIWVTEQVDAEDGIFLATTPIAIEALIEQLWQQAQKAISSTA